MHTLLTFFPPDSATLSVWCSKGASDRDVLVWVLISRRGLCWRALLRLIVVISNQLTAYCQQACGGSQPFLLFLFFSRGLQCAMQTQISHCAQLKRGTATENGSFLKDVRGYPSCKPFPYEECMQPRSLSLINVFETNIVPCLILTLEIKRCNMASPPCGTHNRALFFFFLSLMQKQILLKTKTKKNMKWLSHRERLWRKLLNQ